MRPITINLDDVDYDALFSLGRSIIPSAAPTWTDHNTHDPGIMLIELAAWLADAQIYSLARLRHDERAAYARLMGVSPHGPLPARGLLWPEVSGKAAPWRSGARIGPLAAIKPGVPEPPSFFATADVTLTTAEIVGVTTRFADGRLQDWTRSNAQRGASFSPFGAVSSPDDRLVLTLDGDDMTSVPDGSALTIGFEIAAADPAMIDPSAFDAPIPTSSQLRLDVEDAYGTRPLSVAIDTTRGLLRSGVLLFRFDAYSRPSSGRFSLIVRSAGGSLLVAPRVRRIALNVLPVRQLEHVVDDVVDFGTGLPDQSWRLLRDGVTALIGAQLNEKGGPATWRQVEDLGDHGAHDPVYAFDPETAMIQFGNKVNGQVPTPGAALSVAYAVSAGQRGNLRANLDWSVGGIAGASWRNSEPTTGGTDGRNADDLRADIRHALFAERPVVTAGDLATAALALTDLAVMRALEVPAPLAGGRRIAGRRRLVVVGPHDAAATDAAVPESPDWLAAVRARLAPLLPVGQRLEVVAPRYASVRVVATLLAVPGKDPAAVVAAATTALQREFAVVRQSPDIAPWPFGRELAVLDIKGRLRRVDGVARVLAFRLIVDGADVEHQQALPARGLPLLQVAAGDIVAQRVSVGSRP